MPNHHLLPPEIWLQIFRWATTSDRERELITATYTPFQPPATDAFDPLIAVKRTLALVCRQWKRLSIEFLYEDLRISRGTHVLKDILGQEGGCGRLVRRVVLPFPSTVTSLNHYLPSVEILRLCTNLETLVRPRLVLPEALQFHFDAEVLPFHTLRRLDWWYHNEAERSGGINSLNAVLHTAPNLQYLSVGGVVGYGRVVIDTLPLSLPELHTLRLNGSNGLFLRQLVELWSLPSLLHVIVDFPLAELGMNRIWDTFGSQLRTVEFGRHIRFLMNDHVTSCLRGCSNLVELNYFLFFTSTPDLKVPHTSITTIGLHAAVNELLQDGEAVCSHIERHFAIFMNGAFPALKRIFLFGEWRGIISHPRLAPMWRAANDHGIAFITSER
ncbi:hypothetical protein Hypma_015939 [Hypsizygus marmoreus]|uniref:Uncharacterized protein n=1 Tax=Hypsizygus marmoreus TaxID=39966 RepID=A0A369KCH4_HYPMA|nr:hypothetical protein Hypma_015939 [Hypsizygus marmoreus]